jgi:hypothetical protein
LKFGAPMEARHHVLVLRAGSRVNVNNSDETRAFCHMELIGFSTESLILAQDERWRRA